MSPAVSEWSTTLRLLEVTRVKLLLRRRSDMSSEGTIPTFKAFVSHVFVTLSHLKILKNSNSSKSTKIIDTCGTTCLLMLNFLLVVSEAIDVKNSYDLPSFAARFNPLLFHLLGLIKWTYCLTHLADIEKLIVNMELCHEMCQKIDSNDEDKGRYRMKMTDCQRSSKLFVNIWLLVCVFGVVQWCANPIIYDLYDDLYGERSINSTFSRHLPYPGCFPWEMNNLFMYIIYFTFQFVGGIGAGIGIGAYDILSITFIMYTCIHLDYLSETLSASEERICYRDRSSKSHSFERKLKSCLEHHNQILEVFEKIKTITSFPLLVQCLDTIIGLCLVSLEASTTEINSGVECLMKLLSTAEYWSGINIELFFYCYFATKICEMGAGISDAFYCCKWEQSAGENESNSLQRIKENKMVAMGIMRAQKPMEIAGGPFYVLSLKTFRTLTSMSLSNALILRQLSNQD
ncbi:odorant receptor 13a [Diachasma alloeum]|uniref:odorant receptor 13a n=1 Tax=Diachasma alloeum TaxID=454923 RepID=UPI0007382FB0|nr:odorant receptor 13a [Diachasma alloeum]